MENKTAKFINGIEMILSSEDLTDKQRQTLRDFDRFNELEAQVSYGTRLNYLITLKQLGKNIRKPFKQMTKGDLQDYVALFSRLRKEGSVELAKAHLKRFFKWLYWHLAGEEEDLRNTKMPKCVNWVKVKFVDNNWAFDDLPTEEEVLKIVGCVDRQRDRALLLTLWETGASPIAVLKLRVKDVAFNQYGAVVTFSRRNSKLKTEYRYRRIPVATAVPDLQLWLSMHPQKDKLNAPLFPSRKGGHLGYQRLYTVFNSAVEKAGIKKHLTLYMLRHKRLTQVADVLNVQELKRFAGHSKYSQVTARYVHVNEKAIARKVYAERGVEVKEEPQKPSALKVKVCPRCKHKNSPTFRFCAMCSMPLDMPTMFDVQKRSQRLQAGIPKKVMRIIGHDGQVLKETEYDLDVYVNDEWMKSLEAFHEWRKKYPNRFDELKRQMWQTITAEVMQIESKMAKAPKP